MLRKLSVLGPVAILAACLYFVPLPAFKEAPGPAHDVLPRIDIDGAPTYQPAGRMLFTTVNIARTNLYDAVRVAFDPDQVLVSEDLILPQGLTEEEYDRITLSEMSQSKIAAVVAVLRRLGDYPEEHGAGVLVHSTLPGTPAHGRLFPGDVITAIDGDPVEDLADLDSSIGRAGPAATLRVRVQPLEGGGEPETVEVRTVRSGRRAIIGIHAVANLPFDVSIESGGIGGPSAGLMWALGVMDLLTPGDLGGGRTLAGTGGIDLRGRVFPIGGVQLKILAAERAGADVFFVPRGNLKEARQVESGIDVVAVASLGDALDYLDAPAAPAA